LSCNNFVIGRDIALNWEDNFTTYIPLTHIYYDAANYFSAYAIYNNGIVTLGSVMRDGVDVTNNVRVWCNIY
jgi:hypothetical protein